MIELKVTEVEQVPLEVEEGPPERPEPTKIFDPRWRTIDEHRCAMGDRCENPWPNEGSDRIGWWVDRRQSLVGSGDSFRLRPFWREVWEVSVGVSGSYVKIFVCGECADMIETFGGQIVEMTRQFGDFMLIRENSFSVSLTTDMPTVDMPEADGAGYARAVMPDFDSASARNLIQRAMTLCAQAWEAWVPIAPKGGPAKRWIEDFESFQSDVAAFEERSTSPMLTTEPHVVEHDLGVHESRTVRPQPWSEPGSDPIDDLITHKEALMNDHSERKLAREGDLGDIQTFNLTLRDHLAQIVYILRGMIRGVFKR